MSPNALLVFVDHWGSGQSMVGRAQSRSRGTVIGTLVVCAVMIHVKRAAGVAPAASRAGTDLGHTWTLRDFRGLAKCGDIRAHSLVLTCRVGFWCVDASHSDQFARQKDK